MAATYNDKEREERITLITDYIIATRSSYRETAKFFNDNYFKISHVTVKDYCDRIIASDSKLGNELKKIIAENTEKTVDNENIKERVLNVANIYANSDFTISEIADNLKIPYWTVYRDLTSRINKLDVKLEESFIKKIKQKLENDRINNLNNNTGKKK